MRGNNVAGASKSRSDPTQDLGSIVGSPKREIGVLIAEGRHSSWSLWMAEARPWPSVTSVYLALNICLTADLGATDYEPKQFLVCVSLSQRDWLPFLPLLCRKQGQPRAQDSERSLLGSGLVQAHKRAGVKCAATGNGWDRNGVCPQAMLTD